MEILKSTIVKIIAINLLIFAIIGSIVYIINILPIKQTKVVTILATKLPHPLSDATAVYDGKDNIYIFGGRIETLRKENTILQFQISTETISVLNTTLPFGSDGIPAVSLGEDIILFGGGDELSRKIMKFSPKFGNISIIGGMPKNPSFGSATKTIGNDILIFGGIIEGKTVVKFVPSNSSAYLIKHELPIHNDESAILHYSTFKEESVFLFGGFSSTGSHNQIVKYDVKTGTSIILNETLPSEVFSSSAVFDGEFAYIIGGVGKNLDIVKFNPETYEIVEIEVPKFPSCFHSANAVFVEKLNVIYHFGGEDCDGFRNKIIKINVDLLKLY